MLTASTVAGDDPALAQNRFAFTLQSADQIESVLASLRIAGGELEDLSVSQADLEDVFVRLVQNPLGQPMAQGAR